MFQKRQRLHQNRWLTPVWNLLIEEAYLHGEFLDIEVGEVITNWEDWSRVRWVPQGWSWVNPVQEVEASIKAIGAGISTLADETATAGRDWEEVLEQRAREEAKVDELGLEPLNLGQTSAPTVIPEPAQEEPAPSKPIPSEA